MRITIDAANSRPVTMRKSRARRAGKTLTSANVTAVPITTGMTANGTIVRMAIA